LEPVGDLEHLFVCSLFSAFYFMNMDWAPNLAKLLCIVLRIGLLVYVRFYGLLELIKCFQCQLQPASQPLQSSWKQSSDFQVALPTSTPFEKKFANL